MRTLTLKNMILDVMDGMKQNNGVVRSENPNSYWTTDGYQDFVSTLLDNSIIEDTQWFNEEETDWDTILSQYRSQTGKFSDGENLTCTITRNEKMITVFLELLEHGRISQVDIMTIVCCMTVIRTGVRHIRKQMSIPLTL